jgi:hypothetical protein
MNSGGPDERKIHGGSGDRKHEQKKRSRAMCSQTYEAYLKEMANRCEVALDAMGELSFSVLNLGRLTRGSKRYHHFHSRIFHSIHLFLMHTGALSAMLWPESPENDYYVHSKNTVTSRIKRGLSPISRNNLNNKQLRFNIRNLLEQKQKTGDQEDFRYNIVSPCLFFLDTPLAKKICAYDPITRIFYFYGEPFKIDDLTVAVYKLKNCIRMEMEKRNTPSAMFHELPTEVHT